MSSRRSAVSFVAFVLVLCHTPPAAAQVSRSVGPHTIEYLPGNEAQADRIEQIIGRVTDLLRQKYGVRLDTNRPWTVRVNVGVEQMAQGVTVRCCDVIPWLWQDWARSSGDIVRAFVYVAGPLDADVEHQLAAQLTARALGVGIGSFNRSEGAWFAKGLPELEARYALGASSAQVHSELAQWASSRHAEMQARFGPDENYIFFKDPAKAGAAWLQYLGEQLGEDIHVRLVWSGAYWSGLYYPTQTLRLEAGRSLEWLWQGFLQWK